MLNRNSHFFSQFEKIDLLTENYAIFSVEEERQGNMKALCQYPVGYGSHAGTLLLFSLIARIVSNDLRIIRFHITTKIFDSIIL